MPRRALATCAVALLAALSLIATSAATAAPVDVTSATPLHWGFKESWRNYVGAPAASGGAAVVPAPGPSGHQVAWSFSSGTYDADTGTTVLRYSGSVHWTKYFYPDNPAIAAIPPGYDGPLDIFLLDVTVSDPTVTIGPDGATVSIVASSRSLVDWKMKDYGRLDVAELDVAGLAPTVAGGTTTWPTIPASVTAEAVSVFSSNYRQGQAIDPVAFSYDGPGGAPDLSEDFDVAGTTPLSLAADGLTATNSGYAMLAIDPARKIGYYRTKEVLPDLSLEWTYQAFDLATLHAVGPPVKAPGADGLGAAALTDPDTGRVYLRSVTDPSIATWIRYDQAADHLDTGTLTTPIAAAVNQPLAWDAVGHRAWEVVRVVPDGVASSDYSNHVWTLYTYTYDSTGDAWTRKAYTLPSVPGMNRTVYKRLGAVASDGSFVVGADRLAIDPGGTGTAPTTVDAAYRIVLDDAAGTGAATPVAGFTLPNDTTSLIDTLLSGVDGRVWALHTHRSTRPGWVREIDADAAGGPKADAEVPLPGFDGLPFGAVDPVDGTLWLGGAASQRLRAVRDGKVVDDQFFEKRNARGGFVWVDGDHTVYAQTSDGLRVPIGGTPVFGVGRFERVGRSPDVATGAPGDATVTLAADEDAEDVTFTAPAASGTPAPTRRWQAKAPGGTRFKDVAGADGATLTVSAQRGGDGTQYRVLYNNAAGRAVSDTATLSVKYAPRVTFDPVSQTVVAGKPATFQVLADGNPAPTVTWQRRVGGFWQDVDPTEDDNMTVDGDTLTIAKTDADQDGARFRARIGNAVATAYTKAATLTVASATVTPRTLTGVRFDWGVSDEVQALAPNRAANFLSAGVSDGSESTYAASAPHVRVLQVSADGDETPATWATRGAHTTSGGQQRVRLTGGAGSIAADGTATVAWAGTFSVNFYGGLVPFTVKNVKLVVSPDGGGTLKGDLSGYGSSQSDPDDRTPVPTVEGVTLATFSGARVDPDGATTQIIPAYAGVAVDLPAGAAQQDRATPGWGAWPQSFVDFQVKTGLAPYWYSSGGVADARKPPHPFAVTVTGVADPVDEEPPPTIDVPIDDPAPTPPPGGPTPPIAAPPIKGQAAPKPGWFTVRAAKQRVAPKTRTATLATLSCPKGGAACRVSAPRTVRIAIGGKAYTATVLVAGTAKAGGGVALRIRLTRAALKRLHGRTATVKVKATITTGGTRAARTISARVTA